MKTYSKIFFAAIAAAFGLASCAQEGLAPGEKPQGNLVTVHFGAESHVEVTRATLTTEDEATFASAWEDGDVLSVYYITPDYEEATVPATWVTSNSSFEAAITGSKGEWIYDALYPAPTNENKVDFGSARTQSGNAYNSKYDLMKGSAAFENADAGKDDAVNDVVFEMDRQTGIAYFHISSELNEELVSATLSVEGGSVAKSEVTVAKDGSDNVTYANGFDLADPDLKDITITFADGTAPKSSDFKLWFNVIPTAYTSMSLTVETTGHKLTINNSTAGSYTAGKLYKVVKEIPAEKWTSNVPVYASLSNLVAAGEPSATATNVTVTLKDEVIRTFTNTKGVNLLVGNQSIQIYCASTAFPTDWTEGGTISGTLTNCEWVLYGGSTWELCPENWDELTYTAPAAPIEVPVYASLAELIAAGEPTKAGTQVTVKLKDEEITKFYKTSKYTNGVYLNVGGQEIEIYCKDVPSAWEVGGLLSGTLTNCKWVLYVDKKGSSTWELCPENWTELTYTAPLESCETPVITLDGAEATITCATDGATIHYTVGESPDDPTESDAVYSVPVTLTDGQTIKAIAIKDGMKPSAVVSKKYTEGGTVVAPVTYTLKFPDDNSTSNGLTSDQYTSTWTAKSGENSWTISNFNNNNWKNAWTYIKAGPKGNTSSHATIATASVMPEAISTIKITIDEITNGSVTSIVLKSSDTSDFAEATIIETKSSVTKGEVKFEITSPKKDMYYLLDFTLNNSTTKNGVVRISQVIYSNE